MEKRRKMEEEEELDKEREQRMEEKREIEVLITIITINNQHLHYQRMVEKREIEQELAEALEKSRQPTIPTTTRRGRDEEGASNHRWRNFDLFLFILSSCLSWPSLTSLTREAMNQILKKLAIKSQENMKKSKDEMTR